MFESEEWEVTQQQYKQENDKNKIIEQARSKSANGQ